MIAQGGILYEVAFCDLQLRGEANQDYMTPCKI